MLSEEDNHRVLIAHKISHEDIYNLQGEDTIITWSDPETNSDAAVSFQEAAGCADVWQRIQRIQHESNYAPGDGQHVFKRQVVDEYDQVQSTAENERPDSDGINGMVELPAPEMRNLEVLERWLLPHCVAWHGQNGTLNLLIRSRINVGRAARRSFVLRTQ